MTRAEATPLLILADDFTGACDAAAAFAGSVRTLVVHGRPVRWPAEQPPIELLSVDLDLRERASPEVELVMADAARSLAPGRLFLKIDSTLRGPIGALVNGALAGSGRQMAVLAPAFPEQGRLLRRGRLVAAGQPGASLSEALGGTSVALLDVSSARSPESVEAAVEQARRRGTRCVVIDADGVDCLRSVAVAWRRHAHDWLLVGSGGLARQVAGAPGGRERRPGNTSNEGAPTVLVVAGSPAPATQAQLSHLASWALQVVVVGVGSPLPPRPGAQSPLVVLCTAPSPERDSGENALAVAESVASWAAGATGDGSQAGYRPGAAVLAGGATARLVCERLGARGVYLEGELEPGIPFGRLDGGRWDGLRVVTKAGGFGTRETLLDVVKALGVSSVPQQP